LKEWPNCNRHEVALISSISLIGAWIGTKALLRFNPIALRFIVFAVVLAALIPLAKGWRYRGRPTWSIKIGVGLFSGLLGGAIAMEGPPVAIFWLGGAHPASLVRSNVMVFITLTELIVLALYLWFGLITGQTVVLIGILLPPFWLGFQVGHRIFGGTSDETYRLIACGVIAVAAVASLPIF
jgi:uncharacterized protein